MRPFCAAIDWGTSNFRLWLIDHAGNILSREFSSEGMSTLSADRYPEVMESHLFRLEAPSDLPVIICGMAGSQSGWVEAPYLDTPVDICKLASDAVAPSAVKRPVRILSGVCQRDPNFPDVMRGEETQIAGAYKIGAGDGIYCLPGTHAKWVELISNRIVRFHTYMTGELFALTSRHSVLSSQIVSSPEERTGPEFAAAIAEMLVHPEDLTRTLFSIRAAALLDLQAGAGTRERLSGLLIGAEIASMRRIFGHPTSVYLVSGGEAGSSYAAALDLAGMAVTEIDVEQSTVQGLYSAATDLFAAQHQAQGA